MWLKRGVNVNSILLTLLLLFAVRGQHCRDHGGQDTPIFDLQESISALDPCNNCYTITTGGRKGKNERGGPP